MILGLWLMMGLITLFGSDDARAEDVIIEIQATLNTGIGEPLGQVRVQETEYGLLLTPELAGLTPGIHGFHLHQHPNCGPGQTDKGFVAGLAAGGHFDPEKTGQHQGPYGEGHLGDLPPLIVDREGVARLPVLAPRLQLSDLQGRSLVIHAEGDNFSDDPKPLGGGGARVGCGVIG